MGQQSGSKVGTKPPLPAVLLSLPPQAGGSLTSLQLFPPHFLPSSFIRGTKNQAAKLRSDTASPALHLGAVKAVLSLQPGGPPWLSYPKAAPRVGPGAQGATWALWERRELAVGLGEVILSGSEDGTVLFPQGITRNRHCTSPWGRQGMLCVGGQSHSEEERTPNP